MSDPYVYTPAPSYPEYNASSYYPATTPAYHSSPFIPAAPLSPYHSPYTRPASLPPSPYLGPTFSPGASNTVLFPTSDGYEPLSTWNQTQRPRRPSWHGTADPATGAPYFQSQYLGAGTEGDYYRDRRRSFQSDIPPWNSGWHWSGSTYNGYQNVAPPSFAVHPWLNGENPRGDFVFDLSMTDFAPRRLVAPRQTVPITQSDLAQPATHPPISRLRIICDAIPQWPIDLKLQPSTYAYASPSEFPPITLADVLIAVHSAMHRRISHLDWARLSVSEETAVTKAYSRRCRSYGPDREVTERADGVKRVDFLLGKIWMRGLRMTAEPGVMKLVLS